MTSAPRRTESHVSPMEGSVRPLPGEEVVISGLSGVFPSSENTSEFMENLFKNVDLITENDLGYRHPESPKYIGEVSGVHKFDAQFFKISSRQASCMEPQSRKLLEQAYSAIFDAGINPISLKGKRVGVFVGCGFSDTGNFSMYDSYNHKGLNLPGFVKNMFSNRISFWLDSNAPSYTVKCACASFMICLERGYTALSTGQCDSAIIGGCNIFRLPHLGINLRRSGTATLDRKSKCFDKNADGVVRSNAAGCIFLQKAKDAKRIYAEVYNAQVLYGLQGNERFLPIRKSEEIEKFLGNFYAETGVSPEEIEYVEAEGAANPEADTNELKAIARVFRVDKQNPVYVGSVKSNMGHSDAASGMCSIAKICLAYHKGQLPANLHCSDPVELDSVSAKKIKIVTKNEPFGRGFTAVNQFSFSGMNCHVLLKGHFKPKDSSKYKSEIPRLVLLSARQEDNVKNIIQMLGRQPVDPEVIGLLNDIYQINTTGHLGRGFLILDENEKHETVILSQNTVNNLGIKRPLWLVYSGMGSQWPGMAASLMKIPIFAATIQKCHKVLEPFGVDLIQVLTDPDTSIFNNILNCFIGVNAVQIALSDVLKEIGLDSDFVIGHSVGEIGCAYWDDAFTAEETILAAYYRGKVSLDTQLIKGSMAAVGLGYKDIIPLCPPEIDVACHNSKDSCTISGPADVVNKFVGEISARGIFAKEVACANIAYHSRYIREAGPALLSNLKALITKPKLRSNKWISTSLLKERWQENLAKYSSAEYHTNNLLSTVYFEETAKLIPHNAVVVEVAPHGLLQAILKRSHPECVHIPLTKRGHNDPVTFLLEAIGKIYLEGYNIKIDALYPKIEYPVSTETQMISRLVEWEHKEEWLDLVADKNKQVTAISREVFISTQDDEYKIIAGCIRNGMNIFPESAILYVVWQTLAAYLGVDMKNLSIVISDVHFHGEAIINKEETFKLNVLLSKGSDYFEVTYKEVLLAHGNIANVNKPNFFDLNEVEDDLDDHFTLKSGDIYNYFHTNGFTYRGDMQSIYSTNFKRNLAQIKYTENCIGLIESLLQVYLLAENDEGIAVPKIIKKLTIGNKYNAEKNLIKNGNSTFLIARHYNTYNVLRCGDIEMRNVIFEKKPSNDIEPDILQSLVFIPNECANELNMVTALQISLQIVSDNVQNEITLTEVLSDNNSSLSSFIQKAAEYIPDINIEAHAVDVENVKNIKEKLNDSDVVVINGTITKEVFNSINFDSFIIILGQNVDEFKSIPMIDVLSSIKVQKTDVILIKMKKAEQKYQVKYLSIDNDEQFSWVRNVDEALLSEHRVVLISEKYHYGLFGFVNNLKKIYPNKISLVLIDDEEAPKFDENIPFYKKQLQKNLNFNVLHEGKWGGYYFLQNTTTTSVENFKLLCSTHGDLDSLKWAEAQVTEPTNNTVQVCYAGVSIKDVQKAAGITDDNKDYGFDFSGYDSKGSRVMGIVPGGAISSTVESDPSLLWPVPNHWSLEEAATVPTAYALAYYCLALKASVRRGNSVFVTGGAGALGQAVISVCLALECEVYTCVSDIKKKEFLLNLYPNLKQTNIGYSQNGDFCDNVLFNTKGKRCNFVVNCASGIQRKAAMKCTGFGGMFLDVNNFDVKRNKPIGMNFVTETKNYLAVKFSSIFKPENISKRKMIQGIIAQEIAKGSIRPLSRVIYKPTEVSRAFRLLALNKNRGRALIQIKDEDTPNTKMTVFPRITYSTFGTYVIIFDETDLGFDLADLMVRRGARKLMINLTSKKLSGFLHMRLESWYKLGAQVEITSENLKFENNCVQFLNEARKLGKVAGIFVIQRTTDFYERLTKPEFVSKYDMTAKVVMNLDVTSRNNCPELSHFVVISNTSQNPVDEYIYSVCNNICRARVEARLPALSLKMQLLDEIETCDHENIKLRPQNLTTLLNAVEISVKNKYSIVRTYNVKKEDTKTCMKIAKSLGLNNLTDVTPELTVKDFLHNDVILEEIKTILKHTCSIEVSNENLRNMSIESLNTLTKADRKCNMKFDSKLGAFFNFVNPEVHIACHPFIQMKTVINRNVHTNDLDPETTHVFLIPGFEGHHHVFKHACERLKARAMTYQLPPDLITTIPEMASDIFKNIKKTFVFKSKFYLLGYSFGVNVALEVAALLEKEGLTGLVFCLDSSPDALRVQLDAYIGNKSDSELQDSLIDHFYYIMSGRNNTLLSNQIKQLDNWSDKLNVCVSKLKEIVSFSIKYMENSIESAYRRIQLAKTYNPTFRLKSEVVLLKGIPHPKSKNLDSDYGLSKFTKKPVKVFDLKSDHANIAQDCRVSNIINNLIDPELLENYMHCLCDTYLM